MHAKRVRMNSIFAIAFKDLRLLFRDKGGFFSVFVFPILFALLFGAIFRDSGGAGGGMRIALVNEDNGPASKGFVSDLRGDSVLKILPSLKDADGKVIAPEPALTRTEAETLLRKGTASAIVVIPKGFEAAAETIFTGGSLQLETVVDPSRKAEAGMLEGKLNQYGFRVLGSTLSDTTRTKKLVNDAKSRIAQSDLNPVQKLAFSSLLSSVESLQASGATQGTGASDGTASNVLGNWSPIKVASSELAAGGDDKKRPTSSWEVSMPQGVVWGLMGCVLAFTVSIAEERSAGTLRRLRLSPMTRVQVLLGKGLGCAIACVLVQAMLTGAMLLLGVQVGNWPMYLVAVSLNAVGFAGVMMAMAGLIASREGAAGIARGIALVLAMIGGGTIPLFFMPSWMQTLSNVSPFKWGVLAFEGTIWRGMSMQELMLPFAVLIGFAIVGFAIGALGIRRVMDGEK